MVSFLVVSQEFRCLSLAARDNALQLGSLGHPLPHQIVCVPHINVDDFFACREVPEFWGSSDQISLSNRPCNFRQLRHRHHTHTFSDPTPHTDQTGRNTGKMGGLNLEVFKVSQLIHSRRRVGEDMR